MNMYLCVHVCVYVYQASVFMCANECAFVCVDVYLFIYLSMYMYLGVCVYMCMCRHMCLGIILFIFGCAGSLVLLELFSS